MTCLDIAPDEAATFYAGCARAGAQVDDDCWL